MVLLASLFALIFLTIVNAHKDHGATESSEVGRIKAFDDLLLMYGKELNDAENLEKLLEEMERLAKNKDLVEEHVSYYLTTLKKVIEKGSSKVLKQEQHRLNNIITSASYQPDGNTEIQYALVRRNIVGAFVESVATFYLNLLEAEPDELAFENLKKLAMKANKTPKKVEEVGNEGEL